MVPGARGLDTVAVNVTGSPTLGAAALEVSPTVGVGSGEVTVYGSAVEVDDPNAAGSVGVNVAV